MSDLAPSLEKAKRLITDFERNYPEGVLRLAYHAALPVALTADLLHLLRINFFSDPPDALPYDVEAQLLLSPLCRQIEGLYEIPGTVRDLLLEGLVERYGPQRLRDVATLLWQYMERFVPWVQQEELQRAQQLTALNCLDPRAANQWLERAESKLQQRGETTTAQWFVAIRQIIGLPSPPESLSPYDRLRQLAIRYDRIREQMTSSFERTQQLQTITDEMREPASQVLDRLNELMMEASPGMRLAAIVMLQEQPIFSTDHLNWLANRLDEKQEQRFLGFQAATALLNSVSVLPEIALTDVAAAIQNALQQLGEDREKTDRSYTLKIAQQRVEEKLARIPVDATGFTYGEVRSDSASQQDSQSSRKSPRAKSRFMSYSFPHPLQVYISFSSEDDDLRAELVRHLRQLEEQGAISIWDTSNVRAGQKWKDVIDRNLHSADIFLMLVSVNYLASDFITVVELPMALERQARESTWIIPVILRPCTWSETPLREFQALPTGARPITTWDNPEDAFDDVVSGVAGAVEIIWQNKTGSDMTVDETPEAFTASNPKPPTVVLFTTNALVTRVVLTRVADLQRVVHPEGTIYRRGIFVTGEREWDVIIAHIGDHSKNMAEVERAIRYFVPDAGLFIGLAAGLNKTALGDVVAATNIYQIAEPNLVTYSSERPRSRYRMEQLAHFLTIEETWLRNTNLTSDDRQPIVHLAPVVSIDQDRLSQPMITTLVNRHHIYVVEEEAYNCIQIMSNFPIDYMAIFGLADYALGTKEHAYQESAAQNAAAFVFEMLAQLEIRRLNTKAEERQ